MNDSDYCAVPPDTSTGRADLSGFVLDSRPVSNNYWWIRLRLGREAKEFYRSFVPGQFVLLDLRTIGLPDTVPNDLIEKADRSIILRRPFSPLQVLCGPEGVEIAILYKVVGPATLRMTCLRPGQSLRVLGPLGKGFQIGPSKTAALLVAGGSGLPPVYHLACMIKDRYPKTSLEVFFGVRTASDLPFSGQPDRSPWRQDFTVHLASEDASIGKEGLVTECLSGWLDEHPSIDPKRTIICACGSEAMLCKLARIASSKGLNCQVSLERYMACGIGLCQGCAVACKSKAGQTYKLCCQDGPVFDAKEIVFDD